MVARMKLGRKHQVYPLILATIALISILLASVSTVEAGDGANAQGSFTVALAVSNIKASSVATSAATIRWSTNGAATSQVFYDGQFHSDIADYAYHTEEDTALVTEHDIRLSGLSSGTRYHFRVRSVVDGYQAVSDDYTFRTRSSSGGGGNGGAEDDESTPPIPPPPGTTDVSDYIDTNGVFQNSIMVESENGLWTLAIGQGTTGLTKEGAPLSEIIKEETEFSLEPPDEPCIIIGPVCNLGPDGATFSPSADITFCYESCAVPDSISEMNLLISFWDADISEWIQLDGCVIDRTAHTISAPLGHFTTFSAFACNCQANFIITDLSIRPQEVNPKENATITALVTNAGNCADSYEVSLRINGELVSIREILLTGGASQEVIFNIAEDVSGSYLVDINGLTGLLKVKEEYPAPTTTPPASSTPSRGSQVLNWPLIVGITGGIIVVAVFATRRRRHASLEEESTRRESGQAKNDAS
jgi:hypothetical protein